MSIEVISVQKAMHSNAQQDSSSPMIIDLTGYALKPLDNRSALELFLNVTDRYRSSWLYLRGDMLAADFFKLSNRLCGELFQQCQTYGIKLIISDDFSRYESQALLDFQFEINKPGNFLLVNNLDDELAHVQTSTI
ncbi:DUF4180 domain-containing protein [Mollicutes bacterium LVI A0039]|nr:DUF4180 domain-containing protein [Mollicutes bacterium LVI A0039]